MTEREITRAKFRAMFPHQGGWAWVVPLVVAALGAGASAHSAKKAREEAKKQADAQAKVARDNADAAAAQAQQNAVQTARSQQLAQEREALSIRAQAQVEANTKQANQEVSLDLGGAEADAPGTTQKRRRQFFADSGQAGGGVSL